MGSLEKLNEALQYIEDNLTAELAMKDIAKIAYCSEYHFQRMFSFLSGITLSEYIRRRRLTLAAMELRDSGAKVIDIALKYGYASPNSFTRAFHQLHGMTPSEAKSRAHSLKAYPQMSFQLTVRGVKEMNVRIEQKDAFCIVGIKQQLRIVEGQIDPSITPLWEEYENDEETTTALLALSDLTPSGLLHVIDSTAHDGSTEADIDYYLGVATAQPNSIHFSSLEIPASSWAVFQVKGSWADVETTWERIYTEWFPSSSYEHSGAVEFVASVEQGSEIWVPIVKAPSF